ncbi:hypothetical protein GOARA_014_00100 [Gordonia araii NBRC 100433]|uniref:Fe-S protein n=1 Tax=Gordonia araii NBRC 100433 TaxID=1073574 RepID=G7GYI7_9ACTN|nr:hypothetical protein [Gordonia araii]NNG99080.1 Fe-S protein [Gordonia araii NBRC 100433]GAB08662.1 hypothetical protein GOARA_014_00100 [Gordonia araii NBRC 100433]
MDLLRSVIVLLHIVGFAITFGALFAEAVARRFEFTRVAHYGLLLSLVTGLALAAPWGTDVTLNHAKIAVKLGILIVLGAVMGIGVARSKRTGEPSPPLFFAALILSATAAAIAVIV